MASSWTDQGIAVTSSTGNTSIITQAAEIDSAVEILTSMGFNLEPFGGRTIVVRSVPAVMQKGDVKQAIMDIMDQMASSPDSAASISLNSE